MTTTPLLTLDVPTPVDLLQFEQLFFGDTDRLLRPDRPLPRHLEPCLLTGGLSLVGQAGQLGQLGR